jgi:hypothetical protein
MSKQLEPSFNDVHLIEYEDPIQSGVTGVDSIPNIQLGNRSIYIKDLKSYIYIGIGEPSGNLGTIFISGYDNYFYIDSTCNCIWKYNGTIWEQISKEFELNVSGLKININGNDSIYTNLTYDTDRITVTDYYGKLCNFKGNKLYFEKANANTDVITLINNNELIINCKVIQQSHNSNGYYKVNSYGPDTGTYQNSISIMWDETNGWWSLKDDDGNYYSIQATFIINGKEVETESTRFISSQSELDTALENTYQTEDGLWFIYGDTFNITSYIIVNAKRNIIIHPSATLHIDDSFIGGGIGNGIIELSDNAELIINGNITGNNGSIYDNLIYLNDNCTLTSSIIINDGTFPNIIYNSSTTSTVVSNNILDSNVVCSNAMYTGLQQSIINNDINSINGVLFNTCTDVILDCRKDKISTLSTGDY